MSFKSNVKDPKVFRIFSNYLSKFYFSKSKHFWIGSHCSYLRAADCFYDLGVKNYNPSMSHWKDETCTNFRNKDDNRGIIFNTITYTYILITKQTCKRTIHFCGKNMCRQKNSYLYKIANRRCQRLNRPSNLSPSMNIYTYVYGKKKEKKKEKTEGSH